ncbi:phenylacetate-CoA oxygenase subunit PaaI [Allopusillimonas soli]|uniref:Phenylacetate-CoA oxygenase subunit PaaC n=1 Tax=Allopusillimonas soli TaxID=659016 RepID=A0A853F5N6_9BURK|nr:1,2-phenylacetyl-CoA epoxidase subunit PaaC [Allopusillimonas soli]NYT35277.1 phenylacetate-CoA oxygenase subunit PaaC [Allopusillimonas soli]TEA75700.1 phenylacetate-CoA oxygenase subunit PaaI [Allopusillimonas soli]
MDDALFEYALRMGDTTLVLSHRLSEWTGHGPVLEEELALSNVSLDLLGQARMWLTLAGDIEGRGRDEDKLAYLRDAPQYRNYLLVEQDNGHYGDTMARQFLFDTWHYFLLEKLSASTDERVAAIAAKGLKEVAYHARRSADLIVRLGDGTDDSHARMQAALEGAWRFAGELFHDDAVTRQLAGQGIVPLHAELAPHWENHVRGVIEEATLSLPPVQESRHPAYAGGIAGRHTEALGYLLAEMQFLQRAYPGASW